MKKAEGRRRKPERVRLRGKKPAGSRRYKMKAAKLLDISRDALRYKMKKFGLAHGEEEQQPSTTHS